MNAEVGSRPPIEMTQASMVDCSGLLYLDDQLGGSLEADIVHLFRQVNPDLACVSTNPLKKKYWNPLFAVVHSIFKCCIFEPQLAILYSIVPLQLYFYPDKSTYQAIYDGHANKNV